MAMFGLDGEAVDRTSHLTVIGDMVNTATLQAMPATVGRGAWQCDRQLRPRDLMPGGRVRRGVR